MSDSEQAIDDDWREDEPGQILNEDDADLDSLLDEIDTDSEPVLQEQDESGLSGDVEAGLGELLSVPEVSDEMDFAADDAGDIPVLDGSEDEKESVAQSVAESGENSMSDNPLAEVAAIAAERNAEAAKNKLIAGGKGTQIVLASVSLLALFAAAFAVWQSYSASARMEELALAMQQRKTTTPAAADSDTGLLRADLEKIAAQVNEMAATVDGSLVELRDNTRASLDAMSQRLDRLEAAKAEPVVEAATAAVAAPDVKPAEVNTEPAAKTGTSAGGGWSVNLISLSNENDADKELVRLRNLGLRVEKHRVEQDGRVWFRLRVPGFTSQDGASAYVETVKDKAGVSNAWVGKD